MYKGQELDEREVIFCGTVTEKGQKRRRRRRGAGGGLRLKLFAVLSKAKPVYLLAQTSLSWLSSVTKKKLTSK